MEQLFNLQFAPIMYVKFSRNCGTDIDCIVSIMNGWACLVQTPYKCVLLTPYDYLCFTDDI
jgi:hypothetical protein